MSDSKINGMNQGRRKLIAVSATAGAVATLGVAVPFVSSFSPSERAKSAGAPVEVDLSDIQPGGLKIAEWRGKPVWIMRRTESMLASLRELDDLVVDPWSEIPQDGGLIPPADMDIKVRSIKPEYMVMIGICTHLGCSPTSRFAKGEASGMGKDWKGGYFCPCHGSTFDLAGRVFKNKPAPVNLPVPPHVYLTDSTILVGVNDKNEA